MTRYSIEPRTRKYVNRYGFLSFSKKISNKYRKQLLDTGLDIMLHLDHVFQKSTVH